MCQNLSWCTKHEWRTRWQLMRVELTACATLTGYAIAVSMPISDGRLPLSELLWRDLRPHT